MTPERRAHPPGALRRLGPVDRDALLLWLLSRVSVVLLASSAGLALGSGRGAVGLWRRWDADLLRKIAEYGYAGHPAHYSDRGVEAFFPGFPLVLRAVHAVVPQWTLAGLLVSLAAGAVAAVALARLAAQDGGEPRAAVLLLVTAPTAVFLFAGYSEALFLAAAVPAWLAARRGHWAAAGLLAAGAAAVRVNGLFLAVALVVQLLATRRRPGREALWLLAPFAVVAGYVTYLHHLTGDWLRWSHAQQEGWGRRLTAPWTAFRTTWEMAVGHTAGDAYELVARLEIGAVLLGVVVTVVLLAGRRWGEATYVGLTVASLATSTFYLSVARSVLLWFPLWTALARAPRWLRAVWLVVAVPLCAVEVVLFTSGRWAG